MDSIQHVVGEIADLEQVSQEILQELLAHPEIFGFIQQHQLTQTQVLQAANTFYEYINDLENPHPDPKLEGYLFINRYQQVEFGYRYTKNYQELLDLQEYIECLYMTNQLLKADIKDFSSQVDSQAVLQSLLLVKKIQQGEPIAKGLFISGKNGVGKTHMLAAIAKEFYKRKQKVILVFVPELIRSLKQNPYTANDVIKKLQNIDVLMLDDIGAEMQTSFSRDEVLLPILNARMNEQKLTFFSSNFAIDGLEHHFTHTQYGESEPVKAKRMIERITTLSDYVGLVGKNHRL